jgi:hypothetical protein
LSTVLSIHKLIHPVNSSEYLAFEKNKKIEIKNKTIEIAIQIGAFLMMLNLAFMSKL